MPLYNPLDVYLDGRWIVSGKVGHLHMGNPISLADSITRILGIIPSLQANPYSFANGITATTASAPATGTDVVLGGLLTQNTVLDGDNSHSFTFDNLDTFSWISQNTYTNTAADWVNTVGGTLENDVTGSITNTSTVQISNDAPIVVANVTNTFQVTNDIFSSCNNLFHRITSAEGLTSYQLGSYDGYSSRMNGTFDIESIYNPPAQIPVLVESGFYTSNEFQSGCVPRSFVNAYYKAEDTQDLISYSIIEVNPEATIITTNGELDVEDGRSQITIKSSELEILTENRSDDKETSIYLKDEDVYFRSRLALDSYEYRLPSLKDPNDGEIIVMTGSANGKIGKFTRFEYLVTSRDIATLASGDFVIIPISFDPLVDFEYYLDRVYITGESGIDGDFLQFFIQDFAEQTISTGVLQLQLTSANIHPSEPGLFYTSTSDANLNTCTHDGQPTMWLMRFNFGAATWTNCKITFTFKLKSR